MNIFRSVLLTVLLNSLAFFSISAEESLENTKNESVLIVTAELEDSNVLELPSSVTVIDNALIQQRNAQQLTDLLNLAPNVNFATGSSRGRFIQIRGVGERSEFIEPVNYSVGVVLDGIDLTGISTAATTLDLQQVEVLRGPQGTLYGANGLAGLINLVSNSPTDNFYSKLLASFESFSGSELSAVVSGPVSEKLGYRFAVKKYKSNGYMNNVFLKRDDTNNLDELSMRGKLVYRASENVELVTSLFFADIDNGYDAFSLDSNRDTYSDQPGHDKQKTNAAAFNVNWTFNEKYWLETNLSFADSELEYGFDEDWSHIGICDDTVCDSSLFGFDWWYSRFDNYSRDNKNTSLDVKLHSSNQSEQTNWVAGLYFRDQQIDLTRDYSADPVNFSNQFNTENIAIYGQVSSDISDNLTFTSGLRYEKRTANYSNSLATKLDTDENLWGGKLSLEYHYADNKMLYGLISRGYKAGGINAAATIAENNRQYDTEFMWNYEAGIKGNWLNNELTMQTSIFYQNREDIQTNEFQVSSFESGLLTQEGGICPCDFTGLTSNAATGNSYGLEMETQWQAVENFNLYASLGLLQSEYTKYHSLNHIESDRESIPPMPYSLAGRSLAHAPEYQVVLGGNYFFNEHWTLNTEIESKAEFYFSDGHNERSNDYQILNLRLTYQKDSLHIHLYANNLTDKNIHTRAFGTFGNDPRTFYETETYYQFSAPRVIGISFSQEFE